MPALAGDVTCTLALFSLVLPVTCPLLIGGQVHVVRNQLAMLFSSSYTHLHARCLSTCPELPCDDAVWLCFTLAYCFITLHHAFSRYARNAVKLAVKFTTTALPHFICRHDNVNHRYKFGSTLVGSLRGVQG